MGDDDDGAGAGKLLNGRLNFALRLRIHRRGGLVQHQDGGLPQHRPGNGKPLLLPAGKAHAPFPHHRVVAVRHPLDKTVRPGGDGRLHNLLHRGVRHAVGDVLGDGAVEQEGILQHQGNLAAQGRQGHAADVLPVNPDCPLQGVVKPFQQGNQRGFPLPGGPHNGQHPPGGRRKAHVLQHGLLLLIAEAHLLERDLSPLRLQLPCVRLLLHLGLGVQHVEHPHRAGIGHLHVLHQPGQDGQGLVKQAQVHQKADHVGDRHRLPGRHKASQPHHDHRAQGGEELHGGVEKGVGEIRPDVHLGIALAALHHLFVLSPLLAEGLNFLHA